MGKSIVEIVRNLGNLVVKAMQLRVEGGGKSARQKSRVMDVGEKGLKFIANDCCTDYHLIVNRVAADLGDEISITGDLLVEILSKLPVKSLMRFKTVCKPWNLLINSNGFISIHLHRKNPQFGPNLECFHHICPVGRGFIVGVCNGIICFEELATARLLLLNPATREFSFVTCPVRRGFPGLHRCLTGFCYLPKTQEYQIIYFTDEGSNYRHVDITTLTLGKIPSLRKATNIVFPGFVYNLYTAATYGTSMFWIAWDHHSRDLIVICYDVIQERFSKMSVPPSSSPFSGFRSSNLIMFVFSKSSPTFFDLWIQSYDNSHRRCWIKFPKVGPLEAPIYPINVSWYYCYILCNDVHADQVEDYYQLNKEQIFNLGYRRVNYVPSLVSVKRLVPFIRTDY